jgi:hypothetical protein
MVKQSKFWMATFAACGLAAFSCESAYSKETPAKSIAEAAQRPASAPLADCTKKGLAYLAGQQNTDGGWGQGGGWRTTTQGGRVEGENVKDPSDVGNTCVAVLALVRSGSVPTQGEYATHVGKGIDFICSKVEKADRQSIWVTDVRDTQLQSKIGQYVDTFLAALVLSELRGKVPPDQGGSRIDAACKKVIAKIETNQKEDGTFAGNAGWASVLSQGLASKALNRAVQQGLAVREETLKRDFEHAEQQLAAAGKVKGSGDASATSSPATSEAVTRPALPRAETIAKGEGRVSGAGRGFAGRAAADAGVQLYSFSANAGRIADLKHSQDRQREKFAEVLRSDRSSKEEKSKAQAQLKEFDKVAATQQEATDGLIKQLGDERFIAGFGNNGGEEFLSHMNISENLFAQGGEAWERWNKSISSVIGKVQNGDGSWSGHHCITGRTFCTSAALLTLMADRAPVPTAEKPGSK